MAWQHLSLTRAHIAYACLATFSLCYSLHSLTIKEKVYLGESQVATMFGIIFGEHALGWVNPYTWGNWQSLTLELSRVILCIEIVAIAVQMPRKYPLKHWISLCELLFINMTVGFLVIGLFIWAILPGISFPEGLLISACVTATDPVLAQAVVGKGKFAQRVPAHLRNLLNAESACNDGVSVPFVFLALNLIMHNGHPGEIVKEWLCISVLYECVFGAIFGAALGLLACFLLKTSEKHKRIDSESFLAYYILLALACAGFGSVLGIDDLLASFCAGTAFAWDGWFTEKTEESEVSTVIDLLLNLSYFVYFGTIIPWEEYNDPALGLDVWRLVCMAICVLLFRRIPAILALKPICPDINNWKEAIFVGHFGPIGVGAVFTAIVAISNLEAEELHIKEGPTAEYPDDLTYYRLIRIIWPCVTFLIVTSIIVHGSSVAVIVLGKHLQSMSFTLTFTRTETGTNWTSRLEKKSSSSSGGFLGQKAEAELESEEGSFEAARPAGLRSRRKKRRQEMRKRRQRLKSGNRKPPQPETFQIGESTTEPAIIEPGEEESFASAPLPEEEEEEEVESVSSVSSYSTYGTESGNESGSERSRSASISSARSSISDNGSELNAQPVPVLAGLAATKKAKARNEKQTTISDSGTETTTTADTGSGLESFHGELVTRIRGDSEALDKLRENYDITMEDLNPVYDNGDVRVPTHGYRDGNQLVIEDQHGEVMRKIRGKYADDTESLFNVASTELKRTFSRVSQKFKGSEPAVPEEDEKNVVVLPHDEYVPEQEPLPPVLTKTAAEVEKGIHAAEDQIESIISKHDSVTSKHRYIDQMAPPKQRVVRTVEPEVPAELEKRRSKAKKKTDSLHLSEKLHGYRLDDEVIIEDRDGNVRARYRITERNKDLVRPGGIHRLIQSLAGKAKNDIEMQRNSTLIPEHNTTENKRIEGKLKAFINNPRMARLSEREARAAARKARREHRRNRLAKYAADEKATAKDDSSYDEDSSADDSSDDDSLGAVQP